MDKTRGKKRKVHRVRVVRFTGLALILSVVLLFTLGLVLQHPRSLYWSSREYSLSLQTLAPGNPYLDEKIWIRDGWSVPSPNDFRHGKVYGLRLGKHLLRLDITDDPIAAIRRNLSRTIPGLLEAIASKDLLVKRCAGEALIKMGSSAQSVIPTLLKRYQQGDEDMEWVILELAKSAGPSAVSPLAAALTDAGPKIRQLAAQALGESGAEAVPCVPKLVKALHDPVPAVVIVSALSLRKIDQHDQGEVSALVGLFTTKDPQVRAGAVFALGEFGEDANEAVQPLMKILASDSLETAGMAARTLGLIGPAAHPAIPLLIGRLDSDNLQTLMFTMDALGRFGEEAKAAIPRLLQLAEKQDQMWGAISALSSMGSDAVPGLVELYRNGKNGAYSMAARGLMKQGTKAAAAVPVLMADLDSDSANRTALAALTLGCIGESAKVAVPRLTELIHDEEAQVRLRAAEALWRLDRQTKAVLPVMVAELKIWAKEPNALLGLTTDGQGQSRQQVAAQVLGEIGPAAKEAVPLLQKMLRSSYETQKEAAAKALKRIEQ